MAVVEHPEWFAPAFARWYAWLWPRLSRRVAAVLTVSGFSRERIMERFGLPSERVRVVPNGVDPSRFFPQGDTSVASVRRRLGLAAPYVLMVASRDPRKNLGRVLRAWGRVHEVDPDVELVIAGAAHRVFQEVEAGELPFVRHLGYVQDSDLPALYTGAEVFVYPSLYEGFGLPVLEAMACGVPVVTSPTGPMPEVAGDAAVLVDPYDPDAIADGILRLLGSAEERAVLDARGWSGLAGSPGRRPPASFETHWMSLERVETLRGDTSSTGGCDIMRVGVIGAGYVGLVAAVGLAAAGDETAVAEADPAKLAALREGRVPFFEPGLQEWFEATRSRMTFAATVGALPACDVVIVAVGTPSGPSGQTDLSQVRRAVQDLAAAARPGTVLAMKSTVPPGTGLELVRAYLEPAGRGLRYVSNPEFLREGKAVYDWLQPDRVVVGAADPEAGERMAELYHHLGAPLLMTDITSAEMVQYASNALLATKISFINEIANVCELVGARIDDVARGVGMDPRLGSHFLQASIGYGGSCFPNDTRALDFAAALNGYAFELLAAVIEVNRRQRIRVVQRLHQALGGLAGRRVAVLGLSFKPGTDDTRESPGVEIARMLAGAGAVVRAYDPVARLSGDAEEVLGSGGERLATLEDAVAGAQAVVVATEWQEFREADWAALRGVMQSPWVVFDGRNCLDGEMLDSLGFTYLAVWRRAGKRMQFTVATPT
ncbi:MAG: nucleotide sugar dehydrogenase [Limnochordaceae bacterium]|nr:nucleotide sugar dehydrogenase [Limnochordaceae bacterium]